MAYEIAGFSFSLPAAADLSTHQYKFVTVNGSGQAALSTLGAASAGVLQDDPDAVGRAGYVMSDGISQVVAGAPVPVGSLVASDANGKAKVAASGEYVHGVALTAATADLQVISVLLKGQGKL